MGLEGASNPELTHLAVPVLCQADLFCERLLANADRHADGATTSRPIVDLSMMVAAWGPIPALAWDKARQAYGEVVDLAYEGTVAAIRNPAWLDRCLGALPMRPELAARVLEQHGGPLPAVAERRGPAKLPEPAHEAERSPEVPGVLKAARDRRVRLAPDGPGTTELLREDRSRDEA